MGKKSRRRGRNGPRQQQQQRPAPPPVHSPLSHGAIVAAHPDNPSLDQEEEETPYMTLNRLMQEFKSLPSSAPWNERRFATFYNYAVLFNQIVGDPIHICKPSNEDYNFLKTIGRTKTEPVFYRCLALFIGGAMCVFDSDPQGEALKHWDDAIAAIDSVSDHEKHRPWFDEDFGTVGEFLTNQKQRIRATIQCYYQLAIPTRTRVLLAPIAGLFCDFCKDPREDSILMVCGHCRMAHYCNRQCQRKAWKEDGHQMVCRKKGDFRVGDVAASMDPFGSTSYGHRVLIKAPALQDPDDPNPRLPRQWEVESMNEDEAGTKINKVVPATRLMRVRPGLWKPYLVHISYVFGPEVEQSNSEVDDDRVSIN